MATQFCNISLKRQRPFYDSRDDITREEQSEGSMINLMESLSISSSRQRPVELQDSTHREEMMIKPRLNRLWFAPRPLIVSMLNNKGVIYMERQQYDEARKYFSRALRLSEKEEGNDESKCIDDGEDETNVPISSNTAGGKRGINANSKNDAAYHKSQRNVGAERKNFITIESPVCNSTGEKGKSAADSTANGIESSCAQNAPSSKFDARKQNSDIVRKNSDAAEKILLSAKESLPVKSEYDEGMDCFKSPIRLVHGSPCLNGAILFNLGRLLHDQGYFEEALFFYKRSLWSIEQHSCQDENLTLALLVGIGNIQYTQDDLVESLDTYMAALALSQSYFGENSLEVAACLNCIGVLHYMMPSTGKNDVALDTLQTCVRLRIELLGEDHIDVGTTWNNIGRIYFQLERMNLAKDAYFEALRIRRKCQGESVDVAATLFNCGQVYHNLRRRDKALALFQKFLKLAKIHFGEFHRDVCIVMTCIGQVFHEKKDYKNALKSFQDALRIGHIVLGPMHPEMAITLNKMGNLYYETGDFDSALTSYHKGLEIEITVLETGNRNTFVTYTNIAEIHKQRGEYDQATEYYKKVYQMQLDHGAETVEIANTLSNIGFAKQQLKDFEGALEANQECLRLRREALGDTHMDVASTLTHIALLLLRLQGRDIALKLFMEAYRILKTLPSDDKSSLAFTMYNIAHIYHHQGSHDDALRFYLATAEIEKGLGIARLDLSITYYNTGQLFYQRGEMELALAKFNDALEIERECYGAKHPTCARTLNEIGNIEMQLGNLEGMMKCYTEALRIYKEAKMEESVDVFGLELWRFDVVHPGAASAA